MKARKTLVTVACAGLLVVGSVTATMAYLTDSDKDVNTFTVGNVKIHLDEKDVDNSKSNANCEYCTDTSDRDHKNAYHLIPGETYEKDPTVTVIANSEASYVRMLVTVQNIDKLRDALPDSGETDDYYATFDTQRIFLLQKLVNGWNASDWICAGYSESTDATTNVVSGTYEFRYKEIVAKDSNSTQLPALFTHVVVPSSIDNEHISHLANVQIDVVAQAIQSVGFESEDAAWAAFGD